MPGYYSKSTAYKLIFVSGTAVSACLFYLTAGYSVCITTHANGIYVAWPTSFSLLF